MINVELICFGNELLIGKTINTNATWLGKRIVELSAQLTRITTVRDILDEMVAVLKESISRKPEIIITTGGMGTTFDDLSLQALAKATNRKLIFNDEALKYIQIRLNEVKITRNIDLPLDENRKKMAIVPSESIILRNRAGSAPGVLVIVGKTMIFAVPGVPKEMEAIFNNEIVSYFPIDSNALFFERTILIRHVPESDLDLAIKPIREKYPSIYMKTHPKSSTTLNKKFIEVELHLTTRCKKEESNIILSVEKELIALIKTLMGINSQTPEIISEN